MHRLSNQRRAILRGNDQRRHSVGYSGRVVFSNDDFPPGQNNFARWMDDNRCQARGTKASSKQQSLLHHVEQCSRLWRPRSKRHQAHPGFQHQVLTIDNNRHGQMDIRQCHALHCLDRARTAGTPPTCCVGRVVVRGSGSTGPHSNGFRCNGTVSSRPYSTDWSGRFSKRRGPKTTATYCKQYTRGLRENVTHNDFREEDNDGDEPLLSQRMTKTPRQLLHTLPQRPHQHQLQQSILSPRPSVIQPIHQSAKQPLHQ